MTEVSVEFPKAGERLRLLAVHAHPDDESSKGAATLAKYVAQGVDVLVVSCTGGERGDILNPKVDLGNRSIQDVRREEMANAARILGIGHHWLGFEDSGYPQGDPRPPLPVGSFADLPLEVVGQPLVGLVRQFRPHVLVTYDEKGGYPHPDHIRSHEVSMYALEQAARTDYAQSSLPAWAIAKTYYVHGFSYDRVSTLHQACCDVGIESPYADWLAGWDEDAKVSRITTRIPCSDYFEVRDAALLAHATQIDPDSAWFGVPLDIQKAIWPTEDYELARTRVGVIPGEDDLFAGLVGN